MLIKLTLYAERYMIEEIGSKLEIIMSMGEHNGNIKAKYNLPNLQCIYSFQMMQHLHQYTFKSKSENELQCS